MGGGRMSLQSVEKGIEALKAGRRDEGVRLLRIALRDPQITGAMRAVALLWLAQVTEEPIEKRGYYVEAMAADPTNPQVRQIYEAYLASQYMPPASPTASSTGTYPVVPPGGAPTILPSAVPTSSASNSPFAPTQPTRSPGTGPLTPPMPQGGISLHHITTVIDGPNGPGTAFFVARDGLLATTRYVVGGQDRVVIELATGRQLDAFVVRSYPEFDLAFIYVEQQVTDLMPLSQLPNVAEESFITLIGPRGGIVRGRRRATKNVPKLGWIPTDFTELPDAGGSPVLDDRQHLVGMMTRNTSSTSNYLYGLHISVIRSQVDLFRQEALEGGRVYCVRCGSYSRALAAGGYYCETCGGLHPNAENVVRLQQDWMKAFYVETNRMACPHCNATVGFHKGLCLRCGRPMTGR